MCGREDLDINNVVHFFFGRKCRTILLTTDLHNFFFKNIEGLKKVSFWLLKVEAMVILQRFSIDLNTITKVESNIEI